MPPYSFEDTAEIRIVLAAFPHPRQHGAPTYDKGGKIQLRRGHGHPRNDLVTVGDVDQSVKSVGPGHDLHGILDQFPAGEREFHPLVVHGNAVAYPDNGKLQGKPSCGIDPRLHRLGDALEMHVAGDNGVEGVHHPDPGAFDLPIRIAAGLKKRAVWRPGNTLFCSIAVHMQIILSIFRNKRGTLNIPAL